MAPITACMFDSGAITIGNIGAGKKTIWTIARQHPGEAMAEWFVEGMIERVVDRSDPVSRRLLEMAVLHIVPNMNPDSKWIGHTYGCLWLTLETPFKDNANLPDLEVGWSGGCSRKLGAAMLNPLLASVRRE
jgi:murein tripeptide amidase MpaA